MKKLMLILFMFLGISVFSQEFKYKIKVHNVTSLAEAKMITDPLREKFKCYPIFNDSTDCFEFKSLENVTKEEVQLIISKTNLILLSFSKSMDMFFIKDEY